MLQDKTYYAKAQDGSTHALIMDALCVPSLKCDLNGGRAITEGLDCHVILDGDSNISGMYPKSMARNAVLNLQFLLLVMTHNFSASKHVQL